MRLAEVPAHFWVFHRKKDVIFEEAHVKQICLHL
jgi:hypothetical protein